MNKKDFTSVESVIRNDVMSLGYTIIDKNNGFDLCAKQLKTLKDKHLAVNFVSESPITADTVVNFLNKLSQYRKVLAEEYVAGWTLEGLVYYTGDLPENLAVLANSLNDSKLNLSFKKIIFR
jgi:hypothetical protein